MNKRKEWLLWSRTMRVILPYLPKISLIWLQEVSTGSFWISNCATTESGDEFRELWDWLLLWPLIELLFWWLKLELNEWSPHESILQLFLSLRLSIPFQWINVFVKHMSCLSLQTFYYYILFYFLFYKPFIYFYWFFIYLFE